MKKRLIYYDLETTGIRTDVDRIIEIAAYDPSRNATFDELVHPQMPIPPESTAITNITDEMVQSARPIGPVLTDFIAFCGSGAVLCAHNNDNFDAKFLHHESKRTKVQLPNYEYIDSLLWSRKYRPDLPKHSLQYLREMYQIPENNAHRALDDVMVLYKIFSTMIGDLNVSQVLHLATQSPTKTLRQMPFGKHRGVLLEKVPKHYLKWLNGSGALDKPENHALRETLFEKNLL